jgi:hypothetical protein
VFVDDSLCPYPDQWQLLASVRRVPADQVDWIVNDATRRGQVLGEIGRTTIERAEAVVEETNPTNGSPVVQILVLRFPAWSPQTSPLLSACEWR